MPHAVEADGMFGLGSSKDRFQSKGQEDNHNDALGNTTTSFTTSFNARCGDCLTGASIPHHGDSVVNHFLESSRSYTK
jgi:hypothetical protein